MLIVVVSLVIEARIIGDDDVAGWVVIVTV
jgi:hypothetical protein